MNFQAIMSILIATVSQAAACLKSSSAPSTLVPDDLSNFTIPVKHCKLTNCHNCAQAISSNFGGKQSRIICSVMYHQPGCCDFYIKRSKGILFWNLQSAFWTVHFESLNPCKFFDHWMDRPLSHSIVNFILQSLNTIAFVNFLWI